MNPRIGLYLSLLFANLLFGSLVALAQKNDSSPDTNAYRQAAVIKNDDERVTKLEQFIVDYPKSKILWQVYSDLFKAYLESSTDKKEKILEYINKATDKAPDERKLSVYENAIVNLLNADLLLDEAVRLSKKALGMSGLMGGGTYEARSMANFQTLLGKIYFKQGKFKEAEDSFKKAMTWHKFDSGALTGLGLIYEKNGNDKDALGYYLSAAAVGKISTEDRKKLEALYTKLNNGSAAGLDDIINGVHKKLFALPFKVDKYKASNKRTSYTALAEVFTGSGCPPCVGVDVAFEGLLQRYSRDELIVLMYHQHIPRPDPMTTPASEARGDRYNISSVPRYYVDGTFDTGGGDRGQSSFYYSNLKSIVDKLLTKEPGAELKLDVSKNDSIIKTKILVSNIKSQSKNLKLQIALVEDEVEYPGENGIRFHPMVVRSLGGASFGGFKVELSDDQTFEWEFDINKINSEMRKFLSGSFSKKSAIFQAENRIDELNSGKLTVVAFIQDSKNGQILQSRSAQVK